MYLEEKKSIEVEEVGLLGESLGITKVIQNSKVRWSQKEDSLLLKTIIQYLRDGKTVGEAVTSLEGLIIHHKDNCEFRYRHVLQYLYRNEIAIAKKEGRALKRLLSQVNALKAKSSSRNTMIIN